MTAQQCSIGIIGYNFLDPSESIRKEEYCRKIDAMHQKLQCVRPASANRKDPTILQCNGQPHISMIALQDLNGLRHKTLDHLSHSLNLLPMDCHFFKYLDNFLHDKYFKNEHDAPKTPSTIQSFPEFCPTGINKLFSS